MPSALVVSRRPLWPPSPPPSLSWTLSNGMSTSSCTMTTWSGVDVVVLGERADRSAGRVHVGGRLREDHAGAGGAAGQHAEPRLGDDGLGPGVLREACAGALGEQVQHHLPHVVPVAGVLGAGVAEPDDEPGPVAHVTFLSRRRSRRPERRPETVAERYGGDRSGRGGTRAAHEAARARATEARASARCGPAQAGSLGCCGGLSPPRRPRRRPRRTRRRRRRPRRAAR